MPSRAEMERVAAIGITAVLEKHGPPIAATLATLYALEAVAMVAFLADATLARFSAEARMAMAKALTKSILEDAQDSVDVERQNRRD